MQLKRWDELPSLGCGGFFCAVFSESGLVRRLIDCQDPREFEGQLAPRYQTLKRHGFCGPVMIVLSRECRQMSKNIRDVFTNIQKLLRDNPARRLAVYSVETRQLAGLLSEAKVRDFKFKIDEPPEYGGRDQAPGPVEYLLAALGACQEITYRYYGDTLGIPLNGVSVKVTGRLDLRGLFGVDQGVRPGLRDVHVDVTLESPAGADDIERLKATVDRHCPVLDVFRNVTPVKTEHHVADNRAPAAA
jgi:uncharacterized OsmC-like protein